MTDAPAYDSLTEQQRCELLARAMGRPVQGSRWLSIHVPNPFTSADDYRALRLWARAEGIVIRQYLHCVLAWPSLEEFMSDNNAVQAHHDPRFKDREVDYDAECRAVIKALGLVKELWV